jgi:hypothetical protein
LRLAPGRKIVKEQPVSARLVCWAIGAALVAKEEALREGRAT